MNPCRSFIGPAIIESGKGIIPMPDILHRVGISAPPEKVYQALSEPQGWAGWWTTNNQASRAVGAINQFRFGDRGFNDMRVLELVPGTRVKWRCAEEWKGTERGALMYRLKAVAEGPNARSPFFCCRAALLVSCGYPGKLGHRRERRTIRRPRRLGVRESFRGRRYSGGWFRRRTRRRISS
jgi:Activator of Hsp90 ATPase homolog 1-like protein